MPKHHRGGPGQLRSHSRSSSATRLGANLQFTQPGAAVANQVPQKLVRRASGHGEQTNTTRVAPPLTRVHSGQRVQSREQIAKRLAPLHTQRPSSRQAKNDAATKKAYEEQRQAVEEPGDEDDDEEWESSVESATPDQEGSGSETASDNETDQAILKNLNLGYQQQQGPTRATQQDFDQQLLQQQQLREYERQQQQARIEQEQREQYLIQQQYREELLQRQQLAQQEHHRMLQAQHRQQQQGGGGQRQYEEQLALQQQYEQRQYLEHQRMLQQQQQRGGAQMRYEDQQILQQQYEQRKYLEQQQIQRAHQQHYQQQQQQYQQQQQHHQQQQQQSQKQQVRQPQPIRQTDFVVLNEADHLNRANSAQRVDQDHASVREVASTPRPTTPRQPSQSTQRTEQRRPSQPQQQSRQHSQQQSQVRLEEDVDELPERNGSTSPTPQNDTDSDTVPPISPTTGGKSTAKSQRSPRPGHPRSRPPSMHSITSSRTDYVRPHPLFRGLSHGPPRTAPLAPLTVVPTSTNTEVPMSRSPEGSLSSARLFLSSSPNSQRTASGGGSPASVVVSVADLTHPFASQSISGTNGYSKNGGRRTSVSGASLRSAATTATSGVLPVPPHLVSVHAGILAGPHERARTISAMNGGSVGGGSIGASSAALSSLTNLPTTTRPPSPQAIAFFPPTNPHANLDAIHPLLPPPYLANHLTILSRRTPLRESFDRVIRAKNAAR